MGRCVFCGWEGKLTKEHAFPDWIREVVPTGRIKGYSQQHRVSAETGEITAITPVRREAAATRRVGAVCQRNCNGGWMSDLEHAAKPVLAPLILGEAPRISEEQQELISFWAIKTAMMLQFLHPMEMRGIPTAHYQHVYEQKQPPSGLRVWLTAASDHFYRTAHFTKRHRFPEPPPLPGGSQVLPHKRAHVSPPNVYSDVIVVGRLVISLVGWTLLDFEFRTDPPDAWRPARRCIWPPRPEGWPWPPDVVLPSLAAVDRFGLRVVA